MEAEGYEVQPAIIPACAVGAPHRRERIWFIAHRTNARIESMQPGNRENGVSESGIVADADSIGSNRSTDNRNRQEQVRPSESAECKFTGLRSDRTAADALRDRLEYTRPSWHRKSEFEDGSCVNVADAAGRGLQGGMSRNAEVPSEYVPDWRNFPTQPPVCKRNDGFSGRLAGITFPRWRNGSIKSLGNAVVPQVPYNIFKIIDRIN
jgi:DNA (cytosine-5)-methyltransferase 1